jgi:hypothetical protein
MCPEYQIMDTFIMQCSELNRVKLVKDTTQRYATETRPRAGIAADW